MRRASNLSLSVLLASAVLPVLSSGLARATTFIETFDDGNAATRWSSKGYDASTSANDFSVNLNWNPGDYYDATTKTANPGYVYVDYRTDSTGNTFHAIPNAPGSPTDGSDRVLRISVNDLSPFGVASAFAYPLASTISVTGDYKMEGYVWANYTGNGATGGGTGSTQHAMVGLTRDLAATTGYFPSSTTVARPNGYAGMWTNENGAASDYQIVVAGETIASGDSAVNSNFRLDARYGNKASAWPGASRDVAYNLTTGALVVGTDGSLSRPSGDSGGAMYYLTAFPQYTAANQSPYETGGATGKTWTKFSIEQRGRIVTYSLNGVIINTAFLDQSRAGTPFVGGNDVFSTSASPSVANPQIDEFFYYDNITINNDTGVATYTGATGGAWATAGNWATGTAPGATAEDYASLDSTAAAVSVTNNAALRLKGLQLDGANGSTIDGTGSIALGKDASTGTIFVTAGNHVINNTVTIDQHATINVLTGAKLTLNSVGAQNSNANITKLGTGTLEVQALRGRAFTTFDGVTKITGTGAVGMSKITDYDAYLSDTTGTNATLFGGSLDTGKALLAVDYSTRTGTYTPAGGSLTTVTATPIARLKYYRSPGTDPIGSRLGSSAAEMANTDTYAYRIVEASAAGYTDTSTLLGQPIDATTVLVGLTFKADSNMDQAVNFGDLLTLAANYNGTFTGSDTWLKGDSNGDLTVNFADLLALAANYGQTISGTVSGTVTGSFAGDWALAQTLAPEPSTLAALSAVGVGVLARRRRA
ncbi:MAG: PEP-CTERM sorting domain-containing protein [Tepidisphaeraceae bacterium]